MIFYRMEVAIKEGNSENSREEMLEEAKAMLRVPTHDHIVNFQGISVNGKDVYILLEFCSSGTIASFLQTHSRNYSTKLESGDYEKVLTWCIQVADAMEFLVENNIIHVRYL